MASLRSMAWLVMRISAGVRPSRSGRAWVCAKSPGWTRAPSLADLPPAFIVTAEHDPLRDEGAAYAARLRDAGVPVEYVPGPGLIHGFAAFLGVVDAAEANLEQILASLGRLMRSQAAPT